MKILFAASNPSDTNPLNLTREFSCIEKAIETSKLKDQIELKYNWETTPSDLQKLLVEFQPDILHYSGHSNEQGEIALQNSHGYSQDIPVQAFTDLLKLCPVKVCVLSSCYSIEQADDLAAFIPYVVCNDNAIYDDTAIAWAEGFYRGIANGQTIKNAYRLGKNNADLNGKPASFTTKLLIRKDLSSVDLCLNTIPDAPYKAIVNFNGLDIGIEFAPGDIRFPGGTPLTIYYGEFLRIGGEDKMHLDVLLPQCADHPNDLLCQCVRANQRIYKLEQLKDCGAFDEHKIALGFADKRDAMDAYLANWKPEWFGGIIEISLNELLLAQAGPDLLLSPTEIRGILTTRSQEIATRKKTKLANTTVSRVAPKGNQKYSINGVFYEELTIDSAIEWCQKQILAGVPIINRLGHTKKDEHQESLEPISIMTWVWKDNDGSVLCEDLHCFTSERAIEWARRLAEGERFARSWENLSYCPENSNICYPLRLYNVAWVDPNASDPDLQTPGFPQAHVLEVTDFQFLEDRSETTNQRRSSIGEGANKMAEKTTGTGKRSVLTEEQITGFVKLHKDNWATCKQVLTLAGADEEDLKTASWMFTEMAAGSTPNADPNAPVEDKMDPENPEKEYELVADPYQLEPEQEQLFTMFETFCRQKGLMPFMRGINRTKKGLPAVVKKELERASNGKQLFLTEDQAQILERLAQEDQAQARVNTLKASFTEWVNKIILGQESIKGFDKLADRSEYPADALLTLQNLVIKEDIETGDAETLPLAMKSFALRLKDVKRGSQLPKDTGRPGIVTHSTNADDQLKEMLDTLNKKADRKYVQMRDDPQALVVRNNVKRSIADTISPFTEARKKFMQQILGLAIRRYRAIENGEASRMAPDYQLMEAMINAGIVTKETAIVNTGAELMTQAVLSELTVMRAFESASFFQIVGMLGVDNIDPEMTKGLPAGADIYSLVFNRVGEEIRYRTLKLTEPTGDNNLFTDYGDGTGKSKVTTVQIQNGYNSMRMREQAVAYDASQFYLDCLMDGQGWDILSEVGQIIADLTVRRLSREAFTFVDNIGRQTKRVQVEAGDETFNSANLVSGNEIVIDGQTVTYKSDITKIYRMACGQTATGTDRESRLIVVPELDIWSDRNQKRSETYDPISFTMADATAVRIGKVYFDKDLGVLATQDAFPGQNHNCAIDYNNCVIVAKSGLNLTALNGFDDDLAYSYVPLVEDGGNLIVFDLAPELGQDNADKIDLLLDTITNRNAQVSQQRNASCNIIVGSDTLVKGTLANARRWQNNFKREGNQWFGTGSPTEDNIMAQITGNLKLFSTDADLLGGDNVLVGTRIGRTKCGVGTALQYQELGNVSIAGAEGDPNEPSTSYRRMWRTVFGVHNSGIPKDWDANAREYYNEPTFLIKVIGLQGIY